MLAHTPRNQTGRMRHKPSSGSSGRRGKLQLNVGDVVCVGSSNNNHQHVGRHIRLIADRRSGYWEVEFTDTRERKILRNSSNSFKSIGEPIGTAAAISPAVPVENMLPGPVSDGVTPMTVAQSTDNAPTEQTQQITPNSNGAGASATPIVGDDDLEEILSMFFSNPDMDVQGDLQPQSE